MKAKDFWYFLCEKYNYRFFVGTPCDGLIPLYDNMGSADMHYMPAANENIGLGIARGSWITGFKSAVLLSSEMLTSLVIGDVGIPTLMVAAIEGKVNTTLKSIHLSDDVDKLTSFMNKLECGKEPAIIFIGKGDLI